MTSDKLERDKPFLKEPPAFLINSGGDLNLMGCMLKAPRYKDVVVVEKERPRHPLTRALYSPTQ